MLSRHYYGIYPSVVTNIKDPDKRGRIRVKCPDLLGDETESAWCEPVVPVAYDNGGDFCLPSVGETAWIMFIGGDIDEPVWLGNWWQENMTPLGKNYKNADKVRIISFMDCTITMKEGEISFNVGEGDWDLQITDGKVKLKGVDSTTDNDGDSEIKFSQASKRENIQSGEKISTIFGKIKKWFFDLKEVAFTGSYNDLDDAPEIPKVGNGKVVIKQKGVEKGSFTLNQSEPATIELEDSDTKYSLPDASASVKGGIKTGFTQTGKKYPVLMDNGNAYVNVPWENTWRPVLTKGLTAGGIAENVYVCFAQIYTNDAGYLDFPIEFTIGQRQCSRLIRVTILLNNIASGVPLAITEFNYDMDRDKDIRAVIFDSKTIKLYTKASFSWDYITVYDVFYDSYMAPNLVITHPTEFVSSLPSTAKQAVRCSAWNHLGDYEIPGGDYTMRDNVYGITGRWEEIHVSYGVKNNAQLYAGSTVTFIPRENKPVFLPVYTDNGQLGMIYINTYQDSTGTHVRLQNKNITGYTLLFKIYYR